MSATAAVPQPAVVPLSREMRQVLAELELCSSAPTQNYAPTGRSSDSSSGRPPGDSQAPHLYWRERWLHAEDEDECSMILKGARSELASLRKQSRVVAATETAEQFQSRVAEKAKSWPIKDVARHFGVTPTFVRRALAKAQAREATERDLPVLDRQRRARELRAQHLTLRQIALHLGVNVATIHRDLAA